MSINCAAGVGPLLNFGDWTMKYYLESGENSCFKMALNFLSELRASCVAFRLVTIRLF